MIDLKVPSPGESISEVEIGSWLVEDGTWVEKDQEVVSLESEKASLVVNAPEAGLIRIQVPNGTRVAVGSIMATIDPKGQAAEKKSTSPVPKTAEAIVAEPVVQKIKPSSAPEPAEGKYTDVKVTPVAREIMQAHNLSVDDIIEGLRRITKEDVLKVVEQSAKPAPAPLEEKTVTRKQMSLLRKKLSQKLVAVKNETAMLTTFNEIDMTAVMDLRNRFKAEFESRHKVKLGFMSFFTLAAARSLMAFPQINSQIDGEDILTFNYADIGIAVQTPKGLMVPVLRGADRMDIPQLEAGIASLAARARENRISIQDLEGGTFSITNGGVFGSLMSTPILNPPQSAILGMHAIMDRPVAINNQVVIRPMMYVALSYDHRLIDGRESVGFLKSVKEMIENPVKLLDSAGRAEFTLLGL